VNLSEAAKFMGVSVNTLRDGRARGQVPHGRVGR
jgi:hypothetical protein